MKRVNIKKLLRISFIFLSVFFSSFLFLIILERKKISETERFIMIGTGVVGAGLLVMATCFEQKNEKEKEKMKAVIENIGKDTA